MALFSFLKQQPPDSSNTLSRLVELVKENNSIKIILQLETKKESKNTVAIPYTADSIRKDLECIYKYINTNKPSDNELAALVSVIMLHKPIRSINKYLSDNGYNSIPDSKIIYMETYIETLKSLREFANLKISKYKVSTVMDGRTCAACSKHNEKQYSVSKAVIGKNAPPFCDQCRCCIIAVFK